MAFLKKIDIHSSIKPSGCSVWGVAHSLFLHKSEMILFLNLLFYPFGFTILASDVPPRLL